MLIKIWKWIVSLFVPKRTAKVRDVNKTINSGLISSEKLTVRYKGGKMFKNYQNNYYRNV